MMNSPDDHIALRDFVAWMRIRRPMNKNAWVDEKTLEYVAQGVERFLNKQSPWPKQRGNKTKPDTMWQAYWLCEFFTDGDEEHLFALLPRHKQPGGVYEAVGDKMNLSADAVESLAGKARKAFETEAGKIQFMNWLGNEKGASVVALHPPGSPEVQAYLAGEGKEYAQYLRPVSSQKPLK